MSRFLFEPLRVVQTAKRYVFANYENSEESRWRMMLIANVVQGAAQSTEQTLDISAKLVALVARMTQNFELVASYQAPSRAVDMANAQRALDHSYEVSRQRACVTGTDGSPQLISMLCKFASLSNVFTIVQAAAPVFRRACPDSPEELINLPSLMTGTNLSLQYYAMLDILLSAMTGRPMFFEYNVTFTPQIDKSVFSLEDGPGLRWLYGVPDRLVITLARMNTLLEAFGSHVDPRTVKELEAEIGDFEPVVSASVDPVLTIRRLVVQECWRQAGFIYLYMVRPHFLTSSLVEQHIGTVRCRLMRCARRGGPRDVYEAV